MEFFNALTLDLKMIVVGIVGCALLALFSGNPRTEKRYLFVLALLAAGGIYRFMHLPPTEPPEISANSVPMPHAVTVPDKHIPIVSTSAK